MNNHKSIEELLRNNTQASTHDSIQGLHLESNTEQKATVKSQEVDGYSTEAVVELIKKSLNIHWQQTISLTAQAMHLDRWGYTKLSAILKKDAEEEHQHAMINMTRLEFFDVDYQPLVVSPPVWGRHDMMAMIQYNLASVREAAAAERATITAARAAGDEITANTMIPLLQGSEDGIVLYESYLKLIEQMGLDNFLSIQV